MNCDRCSKEITMGNGYKVGKEKICDILIDNFHEGLRKLESYIAPAANEQGQAPAAG